MNKLSKFYILFLLLIISAGLILRVYKLDSVPLGISWDEASVGYNAYTILHWFRDEWGRVLPITFKSFEDYKNPVHVYFTVPFIAAFGLSELGVRLSAALFGVGNILLMYLLGSKIFKNKLAGLIGAFILTVSPYNLQFSRFNHELNFAIFFFTLGLYLFLKGKEKKGYIIASFIAFGVDLLTYQSAKIVTPPLVMLLIVLYFREYKDRLKYLFWGIGIYFLFIILLFVKPELLGGARLKQNAIPDNLIFETSIYKKTGNRYLGLFNVVTDRYKAYFENQFLFESGDSNPRHSIQIVGTFYKIDKYFLLLGLLFLIYGIFFKREKFFFLILIWALMAPLPAAASSGEPHAARAMFMTVSWHLVIVLGVFEIYKLLQLIKLPGTLRNKILPTLFLLGVFVLTIKQFSNYLRYYYGEYAARYSIEWQYGMRDIVAFVKKNPQFRDVYMTDAHSQPYIFFLFYLKTPPPLFLQTVRYNETDSRSSNLVTDFSKYHFGMWDQIESYPDPEILYIVNPSVYDGLRHKEKFGVMEQIKYPNGTNAFYIVNGLL